ncbi:MAG: hypothetical protein MK133_16335 [Planctomycetes bacterium]|nr:hypothetical protein [Planctomycetota bacterium]
MIICDLTGTGVQDTAIARFAFEKACCEVQVGWSFPLFSRRAAGRCRQWRPRAFWSCSALSST